MKIATISPGYRGSHFPENTPQLVKTTHHHDTPLRLVEVIVAINDKHKRARVRTVVAAAGGDLRNIYKTGDVTGHEFVYSSVGQAV